MHSDLWARVSPAKAHPELERSLSLIVTTAPRIFNAQLRAFDLTCIIISSSYPLYTMTTVIFARGGMNIGRLRWPPCNKR